MSFIIERNVLKSKEEEELFEAFIWKGEIITRLATDVSTQAWLIKLFTWRKFKHELRWFDVGNPQTQTTKCAFSAKALCWHEFVRQSLFEIPESLAVCIVQLALPPFTYSIFIALSPPPQFCNFSLISPFSIFNFSYFRNVRYMWHSTNVRSILGKIGKIYYWTSLTRFYIFAGVGKGERMNTFHSFFRMLCLH